ncbi:MAG: 2-succinyl-5-enolpyruvyl-6-hydroxy-3-cyclohexene-1-carboxylic-acid synthase, partial [Alphaproteobacteria bacterium]
GPVHLNLPLREPLVADDPSPGRLAGRADGQPWVRIASAERWPAGAEVARLAGSVAGRRGCIVAGPRTGAASVDAVALLARHLGWPILADPLSGLRYGTHAALDLVVDAYDVFLRDPGLARDFDPEVVLRFGALPTSKPLQRWLAGTEARQVLVGPGSTWGDPSFSVAEVIEGDAGALCDGLRASLPPRTSSCPWTARWIDLARRTRRAVDELAPRGEHLFEGAIAGRLPALLPAEAAL